MKGIKGIMIGIASLVMLLGINVNALVYEDTALMRAVASYDIYQVKAVLDTGVDINEQDELGYTAIMYSPYYGSEEIIKLLLENGADVNMKNKMGVNALMLSLIHI